jgi:glyoxylase-like metal-dependent hydrolase (beta-lactamase superfamily II)
MMVFDPAKNISAYQEFADQNNAAIVKTFETHRQTDYISGSLALNRTVGAQIFAPEPDFGVANFEFTPVTDGDIIGFTKGGPRVKVVSTPGHTPGSTCCLIDDTYFITGDTVFIQSIGRPDLGGQVEAWAKMLFDTVQSKIKPLDGAVTALPGHYMDWREADEDLIFMASLDKIKADNTRIYAIEEEAAFIDFFKQNMRDQPEEYARIREINAGLEEPDEEEADTRDLGKNECAASKMAAA